MRLLALIFLCMSLKALAVETEVSGNLEVQGRHVKNNERARRDLYEDWREDQFYFMYGNLNGKAQFKDSRIEANGILRHSRSDLYNPPPLLGQKRDAYLATKIYMFPERLVARDLFKIEYDKKGEDYRTQAEFNKFFYEKSFERYRFMIGRLYINYGQGEIFNPINPFNQPTGLTSIQQVAQGNDGLGFKSFVSDRHTIDFFVLGDQNEEKGGRREGKIDKTFWAHGEYQYSDELQLDYVGGEDLNRYKLGGQLNYKLEESMVFLQALYQSQLLINQDSNNLWDVALGYDRQLNSKWHLRSEGGYQKADRYVQFANFNRFLPTEYFLALANQYEPHPLLKLSATLVTDLKYGFAYFIAKGTYNATENSEVEIFTYQPVARGGDMSNPAQKIVTSDIGLAVRAFF